MVADNPRPCNHLETGWEMDLPATGLRIVLVDDCPDNAKLLAMLLTAYGHTVLTLIDSRSVVPTVKEYDPDVVLLDMAMPQVDGCQAAVLLRSGNFVKPIIAISGFADEEHRALATAAGIDHYLAKPIEVEVLNKLLSAYDAAPSRIDIGFNAHN
jgi:CheY-like chemotaxis protein